MAHVPIPAVVSTLTLLALLTAADAWACTAPLVCKPKTSLIPGAQIPANAQAIPVLLPGLSATLIAAPGTRTSNPWQRA